MRISLTIALLLSFALTGCLSTVRVKRAPLSEPELEKQLPPPTDADKAEQQQEIKAQNLQTKVEGIPFYIKVAKCKQETSWLQPVYTLTLKKTVKERFKDEAAANKAADACKKEKLKNPAADCADKPKLEDSVNTWSQVLSLSQFQTTDAVRDLRVRTATPGQMSQLLANIIEQDWRAISGLPPYLPLQQKEGALIASSNVIQVSNTSTPEALVDYSRLYYYNGVRPWVGSSQVDVKLASDGTMTEGSSQVQSQTLSTILSALPISSVLSEVSKAAIASPLKEIIIEGENPLGRQEDPYETIKTFEYILTIQQENYKYTRTAYAAFAIPCVPVTDGVQTGYALTIETPSGGAAKKEDPNTVKVSGTVVLPSPATTPPAPATK